MTTLSSPGPCPEDRTRSPEGRRSSRPTPSLPDDALDLLDDPIDDGPAAVSSLLSRARLPITAEGILWFIGVVLVLAGSLYFTESNWDRWSPPVRASVVTVGLVVYQALFVGLAAFLAARRAPALPVRVLAGLGAALVVMIGWSAAALAGHVLVLAIAAVIAAAALATVAMRVGDVNAEARGVALWMGAAAGAVMIAMTCSRQPALLATSVAAVALFLLARATWTAATASRGVFGFAATYAAYLGVATTVGAATHPDVVPAWIFAPAIAAIAVAVDGAALRRATGGAAPRIAVMVAAVTALGFALTSNVVPVAGRVAVLATAALSTWALFVRARRDGRRLPMALAVVSGLFVYFFLPAPFTAVIELVLSSAKSALGYDDRPLPVAYYGVTFVPYLAAWWIAERRGAFGGLASAVRLVLFGVAATLIALAFAQWSDARPVLFTVPIYIVALALDGRIGRTDRFAAAATGAERSSRVARRPARFGPTRFATVPVHAACVLVVLYALRATHAWLGADVWFFGLAAAAAALAPWARGVLRPDAEGATAAAARRTIVRSYATAAALAALAGPLVFAAAALPIDAGLAIATLALTSAALLTFASPRVGLTAIALLGALAVGIWSRPDLAAPITVCVASTWCVLGLAPAGATSLAARRLAPFGALAGALLVLLGAGAWWPAAVAIVVLVASALGHPWWLVAAGLVSAALSARLAPELGLPGPLTVGAVACALSWLAHVLGARRGDGAASDAPAWSSGPAKADEANVAERGEPFTGDLVPGASEALRREAGGAAPGGAHHASDLVPRASEASPHATRAPRGVVANVVLSALASFAAPLDVAALAAGTVAAVALFRADPSAALALWLLVVTSVVLRWVAATPRLGALTLIAGVTATLGWFEPRLLLAPAAFTVAMALLRSASARRMRIAALLAGVLATVATVNTIEAIPFALGLLGAATISIHALTHGARRIGAALAATTAFAAAVELAPEGLLVALAFLVPLAYTRWRHGAADAPRNVAATTPVEGPRHHTTGGAATIRSERVANGDGFTRLPVDDASAPLAEPGPHRTGSPHAIQGAAPHPTAADAAPEAFLAFDFEALVDVANTRARKATSSWRLLVVLAPLLTLIGTASVAAGAPFASALPAACALVLGLTVVGRPWRTVAPLLAAWGGFVLALLAERALHVPIAIGASVVALVGTIVCRLFESRREPTSVALPRLAAALAIAAAIVTVAAAAPFNVLRSPYTLSGWFVWFAALGTLLYAISGLRWVHGLVLVAATLGGLLPLFDLIEGVTNLPNGTSYLWAHVLATGLLAVLPSLHAADRSAGFFARPFTPGVPALVAVLMLAVGAIVAVGLQVSGGHVVSLPTLGLTLAAVFVANTHPARFTGHAAVLTVLTLGLHIGADLYALPGAAVGTAAAALGILAWGRGRPSANVVAFTAIGVAVCMTRFATHGFSTSLVLAVLTAGLALLYTRRPRREVLMLGALAAAGSTTWGWFGVGRILSTGQGPVHIVPFVASGFLAVAALLYVLRLVYAPPLPRGDEARHFERPLAGARRILVVAAVLATAGHIAVVAQPRTLALVVNLAVVVVGLATFARAAQRHGRGIDAVLVQGTLFVAWCLLRRQFAFLAGVDHADAYAMLVAAFAYTGVHALVQRGTLAPAYAQSARLLSMLFPVGAALLFEPDVSWRTCAMMTGASLAYAFAARIGVARLAAPLATVLLNAATVVAWVKAGVQDPQLYALPIGASCLFLAHLYRDELSDSAVATIRVIALFGVYLSSFVSVLTFDAPSHSLVMAVLAVLGALAGVTLRVRSYLLLGAGFLVVDLGTSVVRFGLSGQTAATLVLTCLGLSLLGGLVVWSLHRRQIVDWCTAFGIEVRQWEV